MQKIGLTEKEASVYLAALRLGKSPVQIIAKEAMVNRGTAYNIIESLTKKGLISSYQEGKKQYFFAESPDQLELLFKQQLEEIEFNRNRLKELLPELKQMDNKEKDKPVVRYFEGKNGIRAMVEDMFDVKKGTEVVMFYSFDKIAEVFSEKERMDWAKKRTDREIRVRALYNKNDRIERKAVNGESILIDKNMAFFKSDIAIYENRIRMASLDKKMFGIVVEGKDLADSFRALFNLAWNNINKKN